MEQIKHIVPIKIEEEMRSAFLDYSMSVIVSRALPDARDGLKPVQRRILYAMYQLRNFHNRPYLKSARIVGDVLGRFHPHGDSSVYEALVRLAQDFSLRYPLIDGQGNFGSIDGDSAAAMRYTEARLEKIADLLIADIDKETVNFVPNYDGKEFEPVVMPSRLPQLLINGASGIAVGMATNIPPHNTLEVVQALEALIEDPKISIDRLMDYVKGPDFPTAGLIYGITGIKQAYLTGHGSVIMRARAIVEDSGKSGRERIVISEIPYQVNKSRLIEKIAELVHAKKIEGISDIRDESNKDGIRVVIDLKKGENADIILNNLYKLTPMQSSFGVNVVALVNGAPRVLNLKQLLEVFYQHRREVVLRRTAYELRKAEERGHILAGLKIAVENIDEVVAIIRKSRDPAIAAGELTTKFGLTEIQTKAILEMRLARLTGLERDKIVAEYKEVMELIADLKDILEKPERVTSLIREELKFLRENHGDQRRTEIIASAADEFTMESLVADEEVAVTVSHTGYVKRTPLEDIRAQRRGGKGKAGMLTREEDVVSSVFMTSNHQTLLCFSNIGRVFELKVYQLPELPLRSRGKHFASLCKLTEGEKIVSVLPLKEFKEGHFIVSVTAHGFVKKTDLMAYSNVRSSGIIGLKLDDGDSLVSCAITDGNNEILIATRWGKAIRFNEEEIRPTGRASRGVVGIRFGEGSDSSEPGVDSLGTPEDMGIGGLPNEPDRVIGMEIIRGNFTILSVCEGGYGKRTPLEEYRVQSRGGKGIFTIKVTERNGLVVGILQVDENDDLMVMTSSGKITRFNVNEVGVIGRVTQGVRLMSVESGEKVISLCKVQKLEGEEV
ncbi:MAG: DNA topoisomerase (ATP-hydrolyzing) subunit A [Deltaproteobacteria bacterium]|nr:DNA topoisomerase (ATP-hydrolyzing) subunit A [Deltaproteobacteria bacterium]